MKTKSLVAPKRLRKRMIKMNEAVKAKVGKFFNQLQLIR
jgi:hypothetical protein